MQRYSTHDLPFWRCCQHQTQLGWNCSPSAFITGAMGHLLCAPAGQRQPVLFFSFLFTGGTRVAAGTLCSGVPRQSPSAHGDAPASPASARDGRLTPAPSHLFAAISFTPVGLMSPQMTRLGWLSGVYTCVWNDESLIQNYYLISCLN